MSEKLREALRKIADLIDSEAADPLDDAIRIATKALAESAPTVSPHECCAAPDDDWEERGAAAELRAAVIEECAKFVETFQPSSNWNIEALRQSARGLRALGGSHE